MTRYVSLLGLGFGDCGKGLFTDHLCRSWSAHTVVRFNGGAQAGHNVVVSDGRHHTFSQFGAGTLVPGTGTVLASPMIVHPTALLLEHEALQGIGVFDALSRLLIDARCRITTPYHQAAGRLREWARGAAAHGTCGVGVGETVRHGLAFPLDGLRYADLTQRTLTLSKLDQIRRQLWNEFSHLEPDDSSRREFALLADADAGRRWFDQARECVRLSPPATADEIAERLSLPGLVIFEGAQGVLLDEDRGFHPHTTWSRISTSAVEAVLSDLGIDDSVQHFGVLRSYLTRHGAGPMPTADSALDRLIERHNGDSGWQGRFRRGHPDAVLLRYALRSVGPLAGLLATHLDVFDSAVALRWCTAYQAEDRTLPITELPTLDAPDIDRRSRLTRLLEISRPIYAPEPVTHFAQWLEGIETQCGLRVVSGSFGPRSDDVRSFE